MLRSRARALRATSAALSVRSRGLRSGSCFIRWPSSRMLLASQAGVGCAAASYMRRDAALRDRLRGRRRRSDGAGVCSSRRASSGMEQRPPDGSSIGEDANSEDDDDRRSRVVSRRRSGRLRRRSRQRSETLEMNDTTKTRSVKVPSKYARNAPNRASMAATMAIGRYGWRTWGIDGSSTMPSTIPASRPNSGITRWPSPRVGAPCQDRLPDRAASRH